ncbi:MAG TPA: keto-deoxy-phosphogluconate aldolase [Lentisphaeria bacterium]|nr:MAG: hypothetical protein A2X47_09980 [Lentisphaerae bacterium GWF2_38_69]HBM17339.1 keto-deoxy-phosphogluconate aldolase [Lentisphaeria bacterium]
MYKYDAFLKTLNSNPIVPVVVIDNYQDVLPLADILLENKCKIIEITLRTERALDSIKLLKDKDYDIIVGAGTVLSSEMFRMSEDAGVDFVVSPGTTKDLLKYAATSKTPYLPGVMTSSEILKLKMHGFTIQKFFPASIAGGINALKTYASVYGDVKFCPTGGVSAENYKDFLALPNICAVGGTWIAPKEKIASHDWETIRQNLKVLFS